VDLAAFDRNELVPGWWLAWIPWRRLILLPSSLLPRLVGDNALRVTVCCLSPLALFNSYFQLRSQSSNQRPPRPQPDIWKTESHAFSRLEAKIAGCRALVRHSPLAEDQVSSRGLAG
jgi:hypothetical protein